MKKIRLRKWFKYLLIAITIFLLIIVVSDAETIKIAILKDVLCLTIIFINSYVLSVYGDLNE